MPFDFDSLSIDGIDTIKVWYHKDYPYSNDVISKATIIFNNGTKMMIKQKMIDWDNFIINIEATHEGLLYKFHEDALNVDKIHSYVRVLKQAYDQRDFWQEVEL